MAFHDVQFPTDISYGSDGGPRFSTDVVVMGGGTEQRNANWTYPRGSYNIGYGIKSNADIKAVLTFFMARRGRFHGFRFKDHIDFEGTAEEIGTGDGVEVSFQLLRNYTDVAGELSRKVTRPVSGTVQVFVDSVEESSGITVNNSTGVITFDVAPGSGEVITSTFEFDLPVRFDQDQMSINLASYLASQTQLTLLELRE